MLLVYRYRIKSLTGLLNSQARACNFVWNFCNDTQQQALKWNKRWPTGFDLNRLTAGSSKELARHAGTINAVCEQYAKSRRQKNRPFLRWRGRRSLGTGPGMRKSMNRSPLPFGTSNARRGNLRPSRAGRMSNRDGGLDGVVMAVVEDLEILVRIVEQARRFAPDHKPRQGEGGASQLQVGLLQMIEVQMAIAARPNEVPHFKIALLRQHVRQQRVGGDIEGHAEQSIGAALVQLTGQTSLGDMELEQSMAGQQCHPLQFADVPRAHDDAPRVRVALQLLDHARQLIDGAAVGGRPTTPLSAVHGAEISVLVGPFVPNTDAVFAQVPHVSVAAQKPQEFVDDRP